MTGTRCSAVRDEVTHLNGLLVRGDTREWLARFIDCVGECWSRRGAITKGVLDRLLPDQRGLLRSGSELRPSNNIPEGLKDISEILGVDVRSRLLDDQLMHLLAHPNLAHAAKALSEVV